MSWLGLGQIGLEDFQDQATKAVEALPSTLKKKYDPIKRALFLAVGIASQNPKDALSIVQKVSSRLEPTFPGPPTSIWFFDTIADDAEAYPKAKEDLADLDEALGEIVVDIKKIAAKAKPPPPKALRAGEDEVLWAGEDEEVFRADDEQALQVRELERMQAYAAAIAAQRKKLARPAPRGGVLTERQQFELMMAARKRSEPAVGTAVGVVVLGLGLVGLAWAFRRRR